ncbi:hypothetical protein RSOLAG1IB_10542 [Rhizoctonia solani AG-1 IB]|uniref:F-box domain-containing protein n=1 Tax=Thanatephorus cucumeris (strain AG1-IB / isolate 7/3/14) TaxID=1108050 RepID=A0A0B7G199_THACB|nr:hypothetical protein RSOLAG1IB_10542 [Rhizoctonia solani AG-1 IB]
MQSDLVVQPQSGWPTGSIQHWEEAGVRLENALVAYRAACLTLEQSTVTGPLIPADGLAGHLDRRAKQFNVVIANPLDHSLASISRSRNRLVSPCGRIPPEILAEIFELVVGLRNVSRDMPMSISVSRICLSLYRLIGVCSVWRRVGLGHSALWALVPLVCHGMPPHLTELSAYNSLECGGRNNLLLAADVHNFRSSEIIKAHLTANGHRFRIIKIRGSSVPEIESLLEAILTRAIPASIVELALCFQRRGSTQPQSPWTHTLFNSSTSSARSIFKEALTFVKVLRFSDILPPTIAQTFTNVVRLRIHAIAFGKDAVFGEFLGSLHAAVNLQTWK